jgi:hypothetical protein
MMKLFTKLRRRRVSPPSAVTAPLVCYQAQIEKAKQYLGSRYLLAEPVNRRGK